jgi:hypothetical protein
MDHPPFFPAAEHVFAPFSSLLFLVFVHVSLLVPFSLSSHLRFPLDTSVHKRDAHPRFSSFLSALNETLLLSLYVDRGGSEAHGKTKRFESGDPLLFLC